MSQGVNFVCVASRIQPKPLATPADVSGSRLLVTPFSRMNAGLRQHAVNLIQAKAAPLQGGDPCGLATEAAFHSAAFAVSPFRLTRRAIKLSFRAQENYQENYPDNHPGVAAG